jgi:hypothetical protein
MAVIFNDLLTFGLVSGYYSGYQGERLVQVSG